MSYYVINDQPVFLTWEREKALKGKALAEKSAQFRIGAIIAKTAENKEAKKLMRSYLEELYIKNPKDFYSVWAYFSMCEKDARENVWELLNDYCLYYGNAYLSDIRTVPEKLMYEHEGDPYLYPMGEAFILNHIVPTHKWWLRYINKMADRIIKIKIEIDNISHIEGDLSNFIIYTKHINLKCGSDIEIMPHA